MKVEQRAALATFRTLVAPLRLRVTADTEGWPIARGRYGQVEWHAPDTVAIYSQTMRMLARLAQIPGVRRHQIGDDEFRLLLRVGEAVDGVHDSADLRSVVQLLQLRRRRIQSERQKAALLHGRHLFKAKIAR